MISQGSKCIKRPVHLFIAAWLFSLCASSLLQHLPHLHGWPGGERDADPGKMRNNGWPGEGRQGKYVETETNQTNAHILTTKRKVQKIIFKLSKNQTTCFQLQLSLLKHRCSVADSDNHENQRHSKNNLKQSSMCPLSMLLFHFMLKTCDWWVCEMMWQQRRLTDIQQTHVSV